ncbi:hypothetical protein V6N13_033516 [Hibiscus sabdariffa]|uniref:Uncharacterized protein n=1 Tax=Hibiscus sabdariffa TaxID=183260 RepID=A0ABR2FA94_9ROSI
MERKSARLLLRGRSRQLATAMTTAPHTLPIWTAEKPTPLAAPRTSNTYHVIILSVRDDTCQQYDCVVMEMKILITSCTEALMPFTFGLD